MHKILLLILLVGCTGITMQAQTNMVSTSAVAEQVMLGNYDPANYTGGAVLAPDMLSQDIQSRISPDSLHAYLVALVSFQTRNSASDTTSATRGIGAARRWIYAKYQQFSAQNGNRLIPSYLQFNANMCNIMEHKDVFAVLPGTDTTDKSIVLVEGHMDTRCVDGCDTSCNANGAEDDGSGTALVLELARVMSKYSFKHTIVFVNTTGEEQGLVGSTAFASYAKTSKISIKTVMNNDIVGGILCGHISPAPGCSGFGTVDSTNVRLFSYGGFNSAHKQLARYVKLEYKEMILPYTAVPMSLNIMTGEDRTNRSGDHVPFRTQGLGATMRFVASNESGDGYPAAPGYADRQHTVDDILGVDTNNDTIIDSFFVNFRYLARNVVINGNAMAMVAISPKTPDFTAVVNAQGNAFVTITQQTQYPAYRIGLRSTTNDWDSVYTFSGSLTHEITGIPAGTYYVSVASVDSVGVESLFSKEINVKPTSISNVQSAAPAIELLQNVPNPADEATRISVAINSNITYREAYISIRDITGREVKHLNMPLHDGINEVVYEHGYHMSGIFTYTLVVDGKPVDTKRMVFTN